MSFKHEDVGYAIQLLRSTEPREPLQLSKDLTIYSTNVLNKEQPYILNFDGQPEMEGEGKKREFSPKSKRTQLRKQ